MAALRRTPSASSGPRHSKIHSSPRHSAKTLLFPKCADCRLYGSLCPSHAERLKRLREGSGGDEDDKGGELVGRPTAAQQAAAAAALAKSAAQASYSAMIAAAAAASSQQAQDAAAAADRARLSIMAAAEEIRKAKSSSPTKVLRFPPSPTSRAPQDAADISRIRLEISLDYKDIDTGLVEIPALSVEGPDGIGASPDGALAGRAGGGGGGGGASAIPIASYAVLSCRGIIPEVDKPNQDRAVVIRNFGGNPNRAFFAIFDGHGPYGHLVAAFAASYLPLCFARLLSKCDEQSSQPSSPSAAVDAKENRNNIEKCGVEAFHLTNRALIDESRIDLNFSGSTGSCCLMDAEKIYCFYVGDSRACGGKRMRDGEGGGGIVEPGGDGGAHEFKPVALTSRVHKPTEEDEKKRIISAGGRVEPLLRFGKPVGEPRVWLKDQHVPGLSVTRAFGDLIGASIGVICTPEVTTHQLQLPNDSFFVFASDGIWEFMVDEDIVEIVCEEKSPLDAVHSLVEEAKYRWEEEEQGGVRDDITAIVVFLRGHRPRPRAPAEDVPMDAAAE